MAAARFVLPEELAEISLNETRGDSIDADVVRAKLLRPGPSHHEQTRFGKTVEQPPRLRPQTGNRSNVNDRAAAFALDHFGDDQPEQAQGRLDVDFDHFVQHFIRYRQGRALPNVGGAVVDENIDGSNALHGLMHEPLQSVLLADVAANRNDFASE